VFSTAYEQHALRAFELGAVDYLLKPYSAERLAGALNRVRALLALPAPPARLQAPAGEHFVSTLEGLKRIAWADVQWVGAADNYVALHVPPHSYLERGSLSAWLANPVCAGLFVRVHRSPAVNPAHVMGIALVEGRDLEQASPRQLQRLVASRCVFARMAPHQKLQLVQAAQVLLPWALVLLLVQ
jgi:DNA-binding LytR/AlgR family response regulator